MPEVCEELCDHDPEDDHVIRLHILEGHADASLAVKLLKHKPIFLKNFFFEDDSESRLWRGVRTYITGERWSKRRSIIGNRVSDLN